MFTLNTRGKVCTVTRTLKLPKSGPLPEQTLQSDLEVTLNLGGVDPKSKVGKEVIKVFENVFRYELDRFGKKQDLEFIKDWEKIGKSGPGLKDAKALESVAKAYEAKVLKAWNDFNGKVAKRYADTSFKSACEAAEKKFREKLDKPTLAFSSEELKPARVGLLSGILGAITLGSATGGLGWIGAAVSGVAALIKGYDGAWNIARKRAGDVGENLVQIDETLTKVHKAMQALDPRMKKIAAGQSALEAELITATTKMAETRKSLEALEARAKKEDAVKEGKVLAEARQRCADQEKRIEALRKQLTALQKLQKSVEAAQSAVAEADTISTAERKGWDGFMTEVSKVASDSTTALGAIATLLKKL